MLKIIVATNNGHKIQELKSMLANKVELLSLKEANINVEPVEDGKTYAENAYIKAYEVSKFTDLPVLSDDSGIEIEALGEHFPGIYSHRYAMENGGQAILNESLTKKYPGSNAKFIAHFVLLNLNQKGERLDFEGIMEGVINTKVEGKHGFGYDPIFKPNGYNHSVSTLLPEEKNRISHRYNASKALLTYLETNNLI